MGGPAEVDAEGEEEDDDAEDVEGAQRDEDVGGDGLARGERVTTRGLQGVGGEALRPMLRKASSSSTVSFGRAWGEGRNGAWGESGPAGRKSRRGWGSSNICNMFLMDAP